ncbi:MAG: hypothetical protein NTW80_08955, partial [Deltaproteobacteria bacterium]|nr:hypothetical protein [Deltaproteobacteria bacterium]
MLRTSFLVLAALLFGALLSDPAYLPISGNQPAYAQPAPEPSGKPKITFKGGPGDTPETAVVILGAPNSRVGIEAEYFFLEKQFGRRNVDWKLKRQSVRNIKGKVYDRM